MGTLVGSNLRDTVGGERGKKEKATFTGSVGLLIRLIAIEAGPTAGRQSYTVNNVSGTSPAPTVSLA